MAETKQKIFDAQFLEALSTLHIVARRVPARGRPAEQRSRDLGSGIEFHDFRPYAAGDDIKSIDWNIYRRLGRVMLRLFIELEDLPLYILPDISKSMFVDGRVVAGLRAALGFAAVALNQLDRVGIFPFSDRLGPIQRPGAGHHRLMQIAAHLEALEPGGTTDFATSIGAFASMNLRRGLAVVVSDFFDPKGLEAVTAALQGVRHRLVLVQLTRGSDGDPGVSGDLRLVDCETGGFEDLTISASVLERYRDAYASFRQGIAAFAERRHAGLVRLDADQPVLPQLSTLFEGGRYLV